MTPQDIGIFIVLAIIVGFVFLIKSSENATIRREKEEADARIRKREEEKGEEPMTMLWD